MKNTTISKYEKEEYKLNWRTAAHMHVTHMYPITLVPTPLVYQKDVHTPNPSSWQKTLHYYNT